jgi:two-component system sporulation sensor kinase A
MERLNSIISKYGNYLSSNNISPEKDGAFFSFKKVNDSFVHLEMKGELIKEYATSVEQFIGETLKKSVPEYRIELLMPFYERSWNGETVIYDNTEHYKKYMVLIYFEPQFQDGVVKEVHAFLINITKWKPEERMINILTLDGTVKYVSDKWVEVSGFRREEIINQSIFPLITPESIDDIGKTQMKVLETKKSQHIYYKGYHRDNSALDLFATVLPVVYKNDIKFIIVIHA